MRPAIATVCSLEAPLGTILEDYAAGRCDAVDLWLGHADAFLAQGDVAALREAFARHGIAPVAASFQGGLLTSQGEARREHWSHFGRRLALCRDLGIPVLVVAGDAARASFPTTRQSAVALVEDVGSPALGVCLDWFHWTVGPSKPQDLWLLSPETLAHVQLSDIADVPREMAADADRILPGEGSSPPDDLVRRLGEIGYAGAVAVELHNPALWRVPPRQFGEIAFTCLRKLLGQAAM
jgi:sugar phosphate isomerase/epimerase